SPGARPYTPAGMEPLKQACSSCTTSALGASSTKRAPLRSAATSTRASSCTWPRCHRSIGMWIIVDLLPTPPLGYCFRCRHSSIQ
ncbi:unnamed protein product, partial [Durusdinium trenchii]